MVLVSYKLINVIVLTGPIVMDMHFLHAGSKCATLLGTEESMTTTIEFITALFYEVDEQLRAVPKHPEARLWPSEVVTLGLLHALKGGGNRPFYRWLTRDYRALFPLLPALHACPRPRLIRPTRAPLGPDTRHACDRGPPVPQPAWYAIVPSLAVRPREPSGWYALQGYPLTQELCGSTLQILARREERSQRDRCRPSDPAHRRRPMPMWRGSPRQCDRAAPGTGRSGTAAYMQERQRSAEPP
jgi:hypothetical protein